MPRSIRGVLDSFRKRTPARLGNSRGRPYVRPHLESLETRLTPTTTTTVANGLISGFVFAGGGQSGLPGVAVVLTGSTTTGRTIDVSTTTNANGAYTFNSVLPGNYNVTRQLEPDGFVGREHLPIISNVTVAQGQTVAGNNLNVGGLAASRVSLAFFLTNSTGPNVDLPAAGSGVAPGFSLDALNNPISDTNVAVGSTNYIDLSGNFFDPDTTDTTVTFNVTYSTGGATNPTTQTGQVEVELFDTDAPQTVTNFLDYIQSGAYQNDLFHRIANLSSSTGNTGTPQILQAGGFTVALDNSTPADLTSISALTTVFQPILSEYSASHPNAAGTLAMALSNGPNSATNEFYFNLSDNSSTLGPANSSGPFTVFGHIVGTPSMTVINNLTNPSNYASQDVSNTTTFPLSNGAFASLPLATGFTPLSGSNGFPTGATVNDIQLINSIAVTTPSQGHLTYAIVGNSNPNAISVALGANTATSTFDANQMQIVAHSAGTSVITLRITDARGEVVMRQFAITAS